MISYVVKAMEWLYVNLTKDYVLTIIFMSVALKLITLPADVMQKRTARKTSALAPQVEKIRKKYGEDVQLIQRKTNELYRANNVNQFAGCLPMLLTFALFIVFVNAMTMWGNVKTIKLFEETMHGNPEYIENYRWNWVRNIWLPDSGLEQVVMKPANFARIKVDDLTPFFDAKTIDDVKNMSEEINKYNEEQKAAGTDEKNGPYEQAMKPIIDHHRNDKGEEMRNGWFALPVIAGITMLAQQFLAMRNMKNDSQTPGMGKGTMYMMSAFSLIVCFQYNAAFAIYWIIGNVFSMITTILFNISGKISDNRLNQKEASR